MANSGFWEHNGNIYFDDEMIAMGRDAEKIKQLVALAKIGQEQMAKPEWGNK
jgi:hypothetical protein